MLAGRKLLLADDSITIQKVVDLTFADEGVKVISFGNGKEAVEKLEEIAPDIVLADVFMPQMSGYEVCEYIKQNDRLKHIPVVLLVGSFEPFDEAEARRVGADDILTKPFQSIRRLIDRVGGLVSGGKVEVTPTAELPKADAVISQPELSTQELELTTADTQQFPLALARQAERMKAEVGETEASSDNGHMETPDTSIAMNAASVEPADELLDLGDIGSIDQSSDDFVLDLDFEDTLSGDREVEPATAARAYVEPQISESRNGEWHGVADRMVADTLEVEEEPVAQESELYSDPMANTQEFPRQTRPLEMPAPLMERVTDEEEPAPIHHVAGGQITLDQLAPEVIDAIARRAVEMLSEKVVREIAWEVVPDLSELMIKRQLEEKKS